MNGPSLLEVKIRTKRLLLVPVSFEYTDTIFKEFNADITTFMNPVPAKHRGETEEFVRSSRQHMAEGKEFVCMILNKDTREFLGCGGVHNMDSGAPELGIWIKKSAHGNKYGREAVQALKDWVAENVQYEFLHYPVARDNPASRKIAESLGGEVVKEYIFTNMGGVQIPYVDYKIAHPQNIKGVFKRKVTLADVIRWGTLVLLFLLPWQTRWMYEERLLNGGTWEYGTLSLYGTQILLWSLILLFFYSQLKNRALMSRLMSRTHFTLHKNRLYLGFIIVALVGAQISTSPLPTISYNFIFQMLGSACLFLILAQAKNVRACVTALWLGGVGQGAFAIWQFLSQSFVSTKWLGLAPHSAAILGDFVVEADGERWLRAYGSFGSPNMLGGFLAIIFLCGIFLGFHFSTRRGRLAIALGQLFVASGLIVSFSRGAWAAAIVGIISMLFLLWRSGHARTSYRSILARWHVFILVLTAAVWFFIFTPVFITRTTAEGRLETRSLSERTAQYSQWATLVTNEPKTIALGVGPGMYTYALWHFDKWHGAWHYQPVHNSYLLAFAEVGAVGLSLLIAFFLFVFNVIKKNNQLFLPVIMVILVGALFDHWWWSLYVGQLVWFVVWGIGLATTVPQE